ncbi:MAG: hypothetical protein QM788_03840 [Roseateles sp.]|uniref:hypothetical protein n=1 Tax=Roseateles sp. TaxID=1971397 RepID=UPI0039EB0B29
MRKQPMTALQRWRSLAGKPAQHYGTMMCDAGVCEPVEGRVAVLPETAKAYFDSLWAAQSADAWSNLSRRQRDFEQAERARGQRPNGSGYAARLSTLYKEDLAQRAGTIAEILKKVHRDFDCPLDEGVSEQLREWGTVALANARDGLEGAYMRHLQRYGLQDIRPIGLEHAYACGQATVANVPARQLWEQRNVPGKQPRRLTTEVPVTVINTFNNTINNSGTIGAVQTGPGATANVQQQWVQGDSSELQGALAALRDALEASQDMPLEARREFVDNIDSAVEELQRERPDTTRLLGWLGAIGAAVETIANVQPAYEAVKALAQALGIPLP